MTLTFSEFGTEYNYDFVKVYDGQSPNAQQMLGALIGLSVPTSLTASSGSMYVEFTSDSSVENIGFSATYSRGGGSSPVSPSTDFFETTPTPTAHDCQSTVTTLTAPTGTISDGPGLYSNSASCSWLIQTQSAVKLTFSELATEANYDFVRVYAGATPSSQLLAQLSGTTIGQPLTSSTGHLECEKSPFRSICDYGQILNLRYNACSIFFGHLRQQPGICGAVLSSLSISS